MTPLTPEEAEIVAGLDSAIRPVLFKHRQAALDAGLPYAVISGLRSRSQQAALATQPDRTTPAAAPGTSKHEIGFAWDLKRQAPDVERKVGILGEQVGLTWGGRFTPKPDPNHFEAPNQRATLSAYRNVKIAAGFALLTGTVLMVGTEGGKL